MIKRKKYSYTTKINRIYRSRKSLAKMTPQDIHIDDNTYKYSIINKGIFLLDFSDAGQYFYWYDELDYPEYYEKRKRRFMESQFDYNTDKRGLNNISTNLFHLRSKSRVHNLDPL